MLLRNNTILPLIPGVSPKKFLGFGSGFGYKFFWVLGMGIGFMYKNFWVLGLGIYTQTQYPNPKPKHFWV